MPPFPSLGYWCGNLNPLDRWAGTIRGNRHDLAQKTISEEMLE